MASLDTSWFFCIPVIGKNAKKITFLPIFRFPAVKKTKRPAFWQFWSYRTCQSYFEAFYPYSWEALFCQLMKTLFLPVQNISEMCAGACRRGLAVAVVSTYADDPLPPSPPHRQGHATDLDMIHSVSSTLLQVHFCCLKEREIEREKNWTYD